MDKIALFGLSVSVVIALHKLLELPKDCENRKQQVDAAHFRCDNQIKLFPHEVSDLLMVHPSIETVTFYQGKPDVEFLMNKIKSIVSLNPWLGGRLVQNAAGIFLDYASESAPEIIVVEDHNICESMPYQQLVSRLSKFSLPIGRICLKKNKALYRLTVIRTSSDSFAILFSLCHVIGDGYTFYKLYGMLSQDVKPEAMDPTRLDLYSKFVPMLQGSDWVSWLTSAHTTTNLRTNFNFREYPECRVHLVNKDWLKQEKEGYDSLKESFSNDEQRKLPGFISTNDILTSQLFKLTNCDVGIMTWNMRNRLLDNCLGDLQAGNYQYLLGYCREDFQHPYLIRKSLGRTVSSLGTPLFVQQVSKGLPNWWTSLIGRIVMITNWASFYIDVQLPGAKSTLHLPIRGNKHEAFTDLFVLFKPNANDVGILSFTRSNADMNWGNPHALFGKEL